ncbi:DUF3148 domain-containing protein [Oscillatoria sp. FACHB-1407]|uniref:regulatory protein SipA n=1 Tax=Oscillatoria sp. FACHB-1407 TaxID=2692847 RepID=UPI0016821049|nr:DUF3148 domain-containing protein [Oscillatoria sp. FACHB-1407]MBD2464967.1 DUF3148 domain-containing protein [Oscillatoria sp. FACHB-1407]
MSEAKEKEFAVGDRVRVIALPPYVKTAESMPMLRPPNVIQVGEEGTVLDRRPGGYWGVRFTRGAFLIESQYIDPVTGDTADDGMPGTETSE